MRTYREIYAMYGERFPVMPEGLKLRLFECPVGYSAQVFRDGEDTPFWSTECSRAGRAFFKVRQRFAPQELKEG